MQKCLFNAISNFPFEHKGENFFYFEQTFSGLEQTQVNKIKELINRGENKQIEFKSTLSLDLKTKKKEKWIEKAVIKTIAGFLNTDGGSLIIGINDSGSITGLDWEINKFHKSEDIFVQYFRNIVKNQIGSAYFTQIQYDLIELEGHKILFVKCESAPKPTWVEKEFFVRTNPATEKLEGPELLEYIQQRFS